MTAVEASLRDQLTNAFEGADYPVSNQTDLVPAPPDGQGTTFETGEVSFTAMELGTKRSGTQEFLYDDIDALADDIIVGLEDAGEL